MTLDDPETGKKKTVTARLQGLRTAEGAPEGIEGDAAVVLSDDRTGERWEIPLKNVKMARLEIEL